MRSPYRICKGFATSEIACSFLRLLASKDLSKAILDLSSYPQDQGYSFLCQNGTQYRTLVLSNLQFHADDLAHRWSLPSISPIPHLPSSLSPPSRFLSLHRQNRQGRAHHKGLHSQSVPTAQHNGEDDGTGSQRGGKGGRYARGRGGSLFRRRGKCQPVSRFRTIRSSVRYIGKFGSTDGS